MARDAERPTPQGEAYVERALALLGDRDPVRTLEDLLPAVERLTAGLSDELSRRPDAPGKWSVLEVLRHLADTELVYGYRLRIVLTVKEPRFEDFDQEKWSRRFGPSVHPLRSSLEALRILRSWNLEAVRSLGAADLAREGFHTKRGRESVERMLSLWAAHDLSHLAQIQRILRS